MGEFTLISWCDHTHNEWIGCTRVSPACDGCYAAHLMETRMGRVEWGGPGKGAGTRALTSTANRRKPYAWNRAAEKAGTRPFVFCSSLADVFDNQVPTEWRAGLFKTIRETPRLVWLLLTKRPQLIVRLAEEAGGLPPNAAIGTTVEDQERANRNVPALLAAADSLLPLFTFVSCEPLLGPISLTRVSTHGGWYDALKGFRHVRETPPPEGTIGWVITGGETDQGAHRARPANPEWFRSLRDQCAAAGVPFHHKQNGEWVSVSEVAGPGEHFKFDDGRTVRRIGKRASGRTIDGIEHNARPEVE